MNSAVPSFQARARIKEITKKDVSDAESFILQLTT